MKDVKENKKQENKVIYCRKCAKELGKTDTGCQSFKIRGSYLTVWQETRFICECNKPYLFSPLDPSGDDKMNKALSYEILNGLGKD